MLDHVSLGVTNVDRSRRFYDAVLRPLGLVRIVDFGENRGSDYGAAPGSLGVEFTITKEAEVMTPILGAHLCFRDPTEPRLTPFTLRQSPRAGGMTAGQGCGRTITLTITVPSCWTLTVIASRLFAMHQQAQPLSLRGDVVVPPHIQTVTGPTRDVAVRLLCLGGAPSLTGKDARRRAQKKVP